jgi:hypothetical protein
MDKSERKKPLEVVDVERIILKWILMTYDSMGSSGSKQGQETGSYASNIKFATSIKCGNFLD